MNITNKAASFIVRTETVKNYLSAINKAKLMTAQEEKEMFAKFEESKIRLEEIKNSDMPYVEKQMAIKEESDLQTKICNEIILRNQRFNFAVAKRYDNNEILMDLVNVGTIGMYEAFEKFDYKEGVRFCTFASWFIRRAINSYLQRENISVRTANNTKILPKVKKIENEFILNNGRYPTSTEVIEILFEKYQIEVSNEAEIYGVQVESIDDVLSDDEENTVEKTTEYNNATASYNDYENDINSESYSRQIQKAMMSLSEKEKTIICMSTGYGYSKEYKDKEIAEIIGLTSERVRQLRHSAKQKFAAAYNAVAK